MKYKLAGLAVVAFVIVAGLIETSAASNASTDGCVVPQVMAHRGGWGDVGRTENTVGAYVKTHAYGLDEWETDIRFDRNGIPFLMHDSTIDRTTNGTGYASAVNVATTTVKMNDGYPLSGQTLDRLLSYASRYGATVAIEPKVVATSSQVTRVLGLLDKYGMRDRVLINSFYTANLAPFKKAAPDLTYSLVTTTVVSPATAAAVGPILNILNSVLTEQLVADYHAAGVRVYAWTVDDPGVWAPHRSWGIDRYVSNNPARYRGWRDWVCTGNRWVGSY